MYRTVIPYQLDDYFNKGLCWGDSIQPVSFVHINGQNNARGASATADQFNSQQQHVGVDGNVLGSGSPIAPNDWGGASRLGFRPIPESSPIRRALG